MKKKLAGIIMVLLLGSLAFSAPPVSAVFKSVYSSLYKSVDLPYAEESAAQKLDIYWPTEGEGPYPVIVSIHGGGYCTGDKVGSDALVAWEGLERGYAVVSVNYRLSSEAVFPAQINDVKAAIRFIKAHAEEYDLNPDQIAVWGSSSGGTLAALVGTSADVVSLEDLYQGNANQSDRVQAVVDWCGPMDLLTMDEQFAASGVNGFLTDIPTSFGSKYLGRLVSAVPELTEQANPASYISPDDPPFFIQHGTLDNWVPVQQSIIFADQLQSFLGPDKVYLEIMPGIGHGGLAFANEANVKKVLDFLDRNLKK